MPRGEGARARSYRRTKRVGRINLAGLALLL